MIPTTRIFALSLLLSIVPFSIGMPQTPVIDPVFCLLCDLTKLLFPCASKGLEFAVQSHEFPNLDDTFSYVEIEHFQEAAPVQRGYTKRIGWVANDRPDKTSIYGGPAILAEYKAVHHRAYFLPPVTGTYKLTSGIVDDGLFVWVGDSPYRGNYNRKNVALEQVSYESPKSLDIKVVAGVPMAFRVLFVNGFGPAKFQITMTKPDGSLLFSADNVAETPFFIPYTCDGKSPAFKEWGKENV